MDRNAALDEVRKRMLAKKGGRQRDVAEWKPPTAKPNEELKFKFIVLPPLNQGDVCATGKATKTMDLYHTTVGTHWINNRPYECPRIHDGTECAFCNLGFDLLSNTDDEQMRKDIAKSYLPRTYYPVNIYFPPFQSTPEELRGQVRWYSLPKTLNDIMSQALMKDGPGDPEDPQAHGFFYLPEESYVFQLEARLQAQFNDYKKSKFLYNTRGPIVKKAGTNDLDEVAVAKILAQRHDLFTKFAPRDPAVLQKLADAVLKNDAGGSSAPAAEAEDKLVDESVAESKPVEQKKDAAPKQEAAKQPAKSSAPAAETKKPAAKPAAPPVDDPELDKLLGEITNS